MFIRLLQSLLTVLNPFSYTLKMCGNTSDKRGKYARATLDNNTLRSYPAHSIGAPILEYI